MCGCLDALFVEHPDDSVPVVRRALTINAHLGIGQQPIDTLRGLALLRIVTLIDRNGHHPSWGGADLVFLANGSVGRGSVRRREGERDKTCCSGGTGVLPHAPQTIQAWTQSRASLFLLAF